MTSNPTRPDLVWQADDAMSVEPAVASRRRVPRVFAEFTRARTWRELLFALLALAIGIAGFTVTVTLLSVGAGLVVTFVGLPLLAAGSVIARGMGSGVRESANRLLGTNVAAPAPARPRAGMLGRIGTHLFDPAAWRARLYLMLALPMGILSFTVAVAFYSYGLGGVTYAVWRPFLPCQRGDDGRCHRGTSFGNGFFIDTPARIAALFVVGVAVLLVAPWLVRAALAPQRVAVRWLLGPGSADNRVAELERTRALAVDDSAATLRRIERDLHDGAQARMVAVAMNVGLAREKLAEGSDPEGATRLLDSAHTSAKAAITELRDLARGIHPPVLDTGLDAALRTLASHSAIPVEMHTAVDGRLDPAIETMAYFCVAELLTNAAKHSRASRISVDARTSGPWLRLRVHDDGCGGAQPGPGSGLAGLVERVATVDGRLDIDSPTGGPTTIAVDVPLRTDAQ